MPPTDREANRFSARAARYARVGANVGGVAARIAGARLFGLEGQDASNAAALAQALGGLKGPIMKVAQLLATIPDVIPPEYAAELQKLQSEAPPMGAAFVQAPHAGGARARLAGAVRRLRPQARGRGLARSGPPRRGQGRRAARLQAAISRHAVGRRSRPAAARVRVRASTGAWTRSIDTREIAKEIGARVREELDYEREAQARRRSIAGVLADVPEVRVPAPWPELSTRRLLTLGWLEGEKILSFVGRAADDPQPARRPPCSRPGGTRSATTA